MCTFFKLAFRNIQKSKLNSAINILGFSLGIAACLFIFLFVKQETSFDDFHLNGNRIYRVIGADHSKDGISTTGFTWFPTAPDMKDNIPGIRAFCRVTAEEPVKCYLGKEIHKIDRFRFADENFFSLLAVLIALVGLFGLTVFTTQTRIKEIGIRKVNGARVSEILAMLNKDFVKWVIVAFVVATPVAYYTMHRWLENFAHKTELSWWIFAVAGLLALGIALLTVSWQSWRAATRNPVEALRYE